MIIWVKDALKFVKLQNFVENLKSLIKLSHEAKFEQNSLKNNKVTEIFVKKLKFLKFF